MRNIRIEGAACLWWAVLVLVLPLKWLLAALAAALFHELCHYFAIRATGGQVLGIVIGPGGAALETGPMEPGRELICALAGPLGGCLLLLFARIMPLIALCALAQTLYNLLPVYPLDGGRALRCAHDLLRPLGDGDLFCRRINRLCLGVLTGLGLWAAATLELGTAALLPAILLLGKVFPRKRPCKTGPLRLQ